MNNQNKKIPRSTTLIAEFKDGFAKGWKMAVGEWFRDALDIRLTDRIVNKKKQKVWTQGKLFSFKQGDLITDCKNEYGLIWEEAVKKINIAIQVLDAHSAFYFVNDLEERKYSAGNVLFQILRPNNLKTKLIKAEFGRCSQVDFIEILKTGNIPNSFIQK